MRENIQFGEEMNKPIHLEADAIINYGSLNEISNLFNDNEREQAENSLLALLKNREIDFNKVVQTALEFQGFDYSNEYITDDSPAKKYYDHTKNVFDTFDTLKDQIPEKLVAPLRLLLLAHDIGKPRAAIKIKEFSEDLKIQKAATKEGDSVMVDDSYDHRRHLNNRFNSAFVDYFFNLKGVEKGNKMMLMAIIQDGYGIAQDIKVGIKTDEDLHKFAVGTLRQIPSIGEPTNGQIEGLSALCKILAASDADCVY